MTKTQERKKQPKVRLQKSTVGGSPRPRIAHFCKNWQFLLFIGSDFLLEIGNFWQFALFSSAFFGSLQRDIFFGADIPRTSRGHSCGLPGPKASGRPVQTLKKKTKHLGVDTYDPNARTSMTPGGAKKKLRAENFRAYHLVWLCLCRSMPASVQEASSPSSNQATTRGRLQSFSSIFKPCYVLGLQMGCKGVFATCQERFGDGPNTVSEVRFNQVRKNSLNIKLLGGIFRGHLGPKRRDIPAKNFMQVAFFCCFRDRGMSRDLGRDVPDLEKPYAGKLWVDFSYPIFIS